MLPRFRAWHKQFKLMKRVRKLDLDYGRVFVARDSSKRQKTDLNRQAWNFNNIELMQWTGLQDKNDKNIYEGDLIEYNDKIYIVPAVTPVSRHHDAECVNGHKEFCDDWTSWSNDCYEIIGNLYETPELMEPSND